MRLTENPVFDIATGRLIAFDKRYEHAGRVLEAKGGTAQAQGNINTANQLENLYGGEAQANQNAVLPFLNSEMTNPQGFGQPGVNELLTAGGQATSGAVGAGDEAANLRASRTGNPSSSASIIDAVARSGMKQQSNNALNVNTSNLQEKLKQQQAGETGISALGSEDLQAALGSLGLSNEATSNYIKAYSANSPLSILSGVLGAAGGIGTGIGAGLKAALPAGPYGAGASGPGL